MAKRQTDRQREKLFTPKLYIFDADGTLRRTTVPGQQCPNRPGEWELMPNVRERLRRIDWSGGGAAFGVASNQGGVGLGYMSERMARQLIEDMVIEAIGFLPPRSALEICTCAPRIDCECRKPKPGMLISILHKLNIERRDALYVGDLDKDKEAARRAGVRFMWAKDFFGWDSTDE